MIDSPAVAAWVAHSAFWALLVLGWALGELRLTATLSFAGVWLAGFTGFPHLPYGAALFPPFVALLDIALIFVVFQGDVRLT
jgi:hypothetical protein